MHRRGLVWALLAAGAVGGCGSEDEEETVPAASESPAVVEVAPEHGGTVVVADTYPIEVEPHASGQVYAYVLGDAPPPPDRVELTIEVPVAGRSTGRPVRMRWNAREHRYEGRVRRVEIVEGPIDVLIVVDGVEHHGHVDVCILFPAIDVVIVEERWHGKHKHKHRGHRGHGGVIHIR